MGCNSVPSVRPAPRRPWGLAVAAMAATVISLGQAAAAPKSINGMWLLAPGQFDRHEILPLTPAGLALSKSRQARVEQGEVLAPGGSKCLPSGMPGMMANEFAVEFLTSPDRVTILSESSTLPRTVYLKEKSHTEGLEPSWNGHSIGHYEGKTLVIDTVNFNDRVGPIAGFGVHSPTTHIVERYHLRDPDTLVGEMTFEDPTWLTKPWTSVHIYNRIKGAAELWEYVCEVGAPGWSQRYAGDPIPAVR